MQSAYGGLNRWCFAGGLLVAGTMADVQTDPPGSLECVRDPDFGPSQDERTGLEVESSEEKFSAEGGGLATTEAARSDEATGLDGGSTDASPSPQEQYADGKTKVGKGLESVGNLTADAFQRIASAVGDVAKAPAVRTFRSFLHLTESKGF